MRHKYGGLRIPWFPIMKWLHKYYKINNNIIEVVEIVKTREGWETMKTRVGKI